MARDRDSGRVFSHPVEKFLGRMVVLAVIVFIGFSFGVMAAGAAFLGFAVLFDDLLSNEDDE